MIRPREKLRLWPGATLQAGQLFRLRGPLHKKRSQSVTNQDGRAMREDRTLSEEQRKTAREAITREEVEKGK